MKQYEVLNQISPSGKIPFIDREGNIQMPFDAMTRQDPKVKAGLWSTWLYLCMNKRDQIKVEQNKGLKRNFLGSRTTFWRRTKKLRKLGVIK